MLTIDALKAFGADTDEGYWNSGAIKTLIKKSAKNKMDGSTLSSAEYTFKSSGSFKASDYAGKWLKVTLRARSNNKISSWWTDEDPDGAATVNYYWVQVPKVKLDSPSLTRIDNEAVGYYCNTNDYTWSATPPEATLHHIVINKPAFEFTPVDYADGYEINYLGFDGKTQNIYIVPNTSKTEFAVYYLINDVEDGELPYVDASGMSDVEYINNHYMKKIGTINSETSIDLPYSATINPKVYVTDDSVSEKLTIPAGIKYSQCKVVLTLPDLTGKVTIADGGANDGELNLTGDNNFTKQLTVQAVINEDNEHYYVSSPVNSWKRISNTDNDGSIDDIDTEGAIEDSEFKDKISIDSSETSPLIVKTVEGVDLNYYKANLTSKMPIVYCVRVMKETEEEPVALLYSYVNKSVRNDVTGETNYTGELAILNEYFDDTTANYKLYISAAKITDSNGISVWSKEWCLEKTGIGDIVNVGP